MVKSLAENLSAAKNQILALKANQAESPEQPGNATELSTGDTPETVINMEVTNSATPAVAAKPTKSNVTGFWKTDPNRTFGISRITNLKYLTHCESLLLGCSHAIFADRGWAGGRGWGGWRGRVGGGGGWVAGGGPKPP